DFRCFRAAITQYGREEHGEPAISSLHRSDYTNACVSASTGNACPEMLAPSGDARNTMELAMSSGEIKRLSDDLASASSRMMSGVTPRALALFANTLSMRRPATEPGQIALTRMPSSPNSIDSDFVNPITAHLEAAYGVRSGKPKRPAADERFVMLAFLLRRK